MKKDSMPLKQGKDGKRGSGLHVRMALSYVIVTTAVALIGEMLMMILLFFLLTRFSLAGNNQLVRAQGAAMWYALAASAQAHGTLFNPRITLTKDRPSSLALPAEVGQLVNDRSIAVVLLVAANGQVLASSSPSRYPIATSVARLLPQRCAFIADGLIGKVPTPITETTPQGHTVSIVQTVWSQDKLPIGAIYLQASLELPPSPLWQNFSQIWMGSALLVLLITLPIGLIFGILSTRGVVRRIQRLVMATAQFANGHYTQRVLVSSRDEVGQLERQFNQMAEHLVESITQRQTLTEQNARLAERARLSRELHDALAQDLFSLRMLAGGLQVALTADSPLAPQIKTLRQTTETMIRELRALLLELRPAQLELLGLVGALEDLAASYSTRLGINVTTLLAPASLPAPIEHALLRIAQEGLSNIARHADATSITLELVAELQMIHFTITDNGAGFTRDSATKQRGLGLRLMEERVQELNGTFTVETAPGQGTCLRICFRL